jgi:hypothetical protein
MVFKESDIEEFRRWVGLNEQTMGWEGTNLQYIQKFWGNFFLVGHRFDENLQRFDFACNFIKSGPVSRWFDWLKSYFIIFLFNKKELSVEAISRECGIPEKAILTILRNYYCKLLPSRTIDLNHLFQFDLIDPSFKKLNSKSLIDQLGEGFDINSDKLDLNFKNLELTLFQDWLDFVDIISKSNIDTEEESEKILKRNSKLRNIKVLKEAIVLSTILLVSIVSLRYGNTIYESYILKQIQIFEPNFFWLDKSLSFKEDAELDIEKQIFEANQIDQLEEEEQRFIPIVEERLGPESEFVLTSLESVVSDLDILDYTPSEFEEDLKGEIRDRRYGTRKAYRLIINSVEVDELVKKVNRYLDMYKVKKVDKVEPGKKIPGGAYYNLNVPTEYLKLFIRDVSSLEKTSIYLSKTWGQNPPGLSRVFMWIKSI